jgi:hypothetical protein
MGGGDQREVRAQVEGPKISRVVDRNPNLVGSGFPDPYLYGSFPLFKANECMVYKVN